MAAISARDASALQKAAGGLNAHQTGSILGSIRNVSVAALARNLADALGPKGIHVTGVYPDVTRTEAMTLYIDQPVAASG